MKTICTLLALTLPAVTHAALFSISGSATTIISSGNLATQFPMESTFPYEIIFDDAATDTDPGTGQSYDAISSLSLNGEDSTPANGTITIPPPGSGSNAFSLLVSGIFSGDFLTISGSFERSTGTSNPPDFSLTDFADLDETSFSTPAGSFGSQSLGGGVLIASFDTITISPVPEPTTPALILLGTLALLRRRAR